MSLIYPCDAHGVSDTFAIHVERGSVNPGTDYVAGYGSTVYAVATGTVTDADSSTGGSGGRTIHVDHDDGSGADYLHLSSVAVRVGQRVAQGNIIGRSGASGYGQEWYYGPHLHISYRRNHSHGYGNVGNLDFDALIRSQITPASADVTPINNTQEDDDMSKLFITTVADDHSKYVFGGQGVIPIPVPNGTWLSVLTAYVDAVNEPNPETRGAKLAAFTTAQWKLIRQALSNVEPSNDLDKAIDQKGM